MKPDTVIGVDLGGTNVRAGLVEGGRLTDLRSVPVRSQGMERDVLEDMFSAIDAVLRKGVAGIGAGVPSVIDLRSGVVYDVQNIRSWTKVPLKAHLEARYHLPAYVNNDANCFAAGEKYFGKAKPYDHAVGLIVGTGLGASTQDSPAGGSRRRASARGCRPAPGLTSRRPAHARWPDGRGPEG